MVRRRRRMDQGQLPMAPHPFQTIGLRPNPAPLRRSGDDRQVMISSRHAETAARPRGGPQGGTTYLAAHPSPRQGDTRAARRSQPQASAKTTTARLLCSNLITK